MTPIDSLTGRFVSLAGRLAAARYAPGEASLGQIFCADITHARAIGGGVSWYSGCGREVDHARAKGAAVGEAFERYCLRDLDDDRLFSASMRDLAERGQPHLAPADLAPVLDPGRDETGLALRPPPDEQRPILWMRSYDLVTGEVVAVPAQYCVYIDWWSPYRPQHAEEPWCLAISNGTGAGRSPVAACLSGLLELLERDAFMLLWYHRLRPASIKVEQQDRLGRRITSLFGRSRVELSFLDLTPVHDVPVVIAAARGWIRGQAVYAVGGGAATEFDAAMWKATVELAGLYAWARTESAVPDRPKLRPEQVVNYPHHLRYYLNPDHHNELEFLFEERPAGTMGAYKPGRGGFSSGPGEPDSVVLRRLSEHLRARGIHAYAVDLTPPGAEAFGWYAYKVVSPELVPLDYHHQARHLNRERLLREPTRRGWRTDQPSLDDLNHAPHPFP